MTPYVPTASLAVDFRQGVFGPWSKAARFEPEFVAFLAIPAIGWFLSEVIAKVVDRVLAGRRRRAGPGGHRRGRHAAGAVRGARDGDRDSDRRGRRGCGPPAAAADGAVDARGPAGVAEGQIGAVRADSRCAG
ncbi:mechanosensitive ion channel family protein [Streptomyces fradiae]